MNGEILKADPGTRRGYILFVFVVVVMGGVAVYLANSYWAGLESELQTSPSPERLGEILGEIRFVFGVVYAVLWLAVVNLAYQGVRILQAGLFPLPTAKVIRDTPVLQGSAARTRALILIALAAVLVVLLSVVAIIDVRLLEYVQKAI